VGGEVRLIAAVLAVLAMVPALAVVAAVLSGGRANVYVVLLGALDGWLVPILGVAGLLAVISRYWWLLACVVVVLGASLFVAPPWPTGGGRGPPEGSGPPVGSGPPPDGGVPLRVMALNLEFGRADAPAVVAAVRRARPDVLALCELTPDSVSRLDAAGLATLLPYSLAFPQPTSAGTGLWSATPLARATRLPTLHFEAVRATVHPAGRPAVTFFAVHPAPPQWRADFLADYRVLRAVLGSALDSGEPTVVAGDLNAAPANGPLRRVLDLGLTDTAMATRWRWQALTWPADRWFPPVLRIDHVLVSTQIVPRGIDTIHIPGTDHRAVVAELALTAEG